MGATHWVVGHNIVGHNIAALFAIFVEHIGYIMSTNKLKWPFFPKFFFSGEFFLKKKIFSREKSFPRKRKIFSGKKIFSQKQFPQKNGRKIFADQRHKRLHTNIN